MDREVAARWYDSMMLDISFKFRRFLHNIPQDPESSYYDSKRTSNVISLDFISLASEE